MTYINFMILNFVRILYQYFLFIFVITIWRNNHTTHSKKSWKMTFFSAKSGAFSVPGSVLLIQHGTEKKKRKRTTAKKVAPVRGFQAEFSPFCSEWRRSKVQCILLHRGRMCSDTTGTWLNKEGDKKGDFRGQRHDGALCPIYKCDIIPWFVMIPTVFG